MTEPAPFFAEMADGPEGGSAWWLKAEDGQRIRVGLWQPEAARGTVFLFPGRTEYIEKYGRAARAFAGCGYATFTIDWRGQGLADRLADDAMSGHVGRFTDYQMDVRAMLAAAEQMGLPRPWYLLAHSMGGCIGLRAVMEGMPVAACTFSGPMWGIQMSEALRPVAWSLSWSGKRLGLGTRYAPGTATGSYVLTEPFETNRLTRDREMYQYMVDHLVAQPELGLGGPSLRWLHEALVETRALARRPSPALPCLTLMGSEEDIVDVSRIRDRMAKWPGGRTEIVPGGRHEVLMEDAETRAHLFGLICDFFAMHGAQPQDLPQDLREGCQTAC
ncbi:MAG: alpha/beta hydrolase [Roseovarius sp.]